MLLTDASEAIDVLVALAQGGPSPRALARGGAVIAPGS